MDKSWLCPRCDCGLQGCSPSGWGERACDSCGVWWETSQDVLAEWASRAVKEMEKAQMEVEEAQGRLLASKDKYLEVLVGGLPARDGEVVLGPPGKAASARYKWPSSSPILPGEGWVILLPNPATGRMGETAAAVNSLLSFWGMEIRVRCEGGRWIKDEGGEAEVLKYMELEL